MYYIGTVIDKLVQKDLRFDQYVLGTMASIIGFDGYLDSRNDGLVAGTVGLAFGNKDTKDSLNISLKGTFEENITISLLNTPGKNTLDIKINDQEFNNIYLNFVGILAPEDPLFGQQRAAIGEVFNTLSYSKSAYSPNSKFKITFSTDPTNNNKPVVTIDAISSQGNINVNELLVKYGIAYPSSIGDGNIGLRKQQIDFKATKAGKEKLGLYNLSERGTKKFREWEEKLKPTDNYLTTQKEIENSRSVTNAQYEVEFDKDFENNHLFKVGDVWLQIPPTHITVSQMRTSYTVPLLGMESKPLSTPVNRTIIKVNVVFTGEQIYDDMVRIIAQFRYCPINLIRSSDLFNRIASPDSFLFKHYCHSKYIPVTMDQYTLYTIDGHPGTVSCVLQFSVFNYSIYLSNKPVQYYEYDPNMKVLLEAADKWGWEADPKNPNVQKPKAIDVKALNLEDRAKFVKSQKEPTFQLEKAAHPYNTYIEKRLSNIRKDYDTKSITGSSNMSIWKIDMDRYFNSVKGLNPNDIPSDKEQDHMDFLAYCRDANPLFTELAHSVSITYNNIFAFQPVLSQSHPGAQYIGPGETVVAINLKGIDMSKDDPNLGPARIGSKDQRMMSSLLKNWSERYGTAEYGFFDDRYYISTTLLDLVGVNIVSIQNTTCTSVESKPGLFDVNILFSKSMFEYFLRNNPIAMYDSYFGLRRLTTLYDEDLELKELVKKGEKIKSEKYNLLEAALDNGLSLGGMNNTLINTLNSILNDINDLSPVVNEKFIYEYKERSLFIDGKNIVQNIKISANASSFFSNVGDSSQTKETKAVVNAFILVLDKAQKNYWSTGDSGYGIDLNNLIVSQSGKNQALAGLGVGTWLLSAMLIAGLGIITALLATATAITLVLVGGNKIRSIINGPKILDHNVRFMEDFFLEFVNQPEMGGKYRIDTENTKNDFLVPFLRGLKEGKASALNSYYLALGQGVYLQLDENVTSFEVQGPYIEKHLDLLGRIKKRIDLVLKKYDDRIKLGAWTGNGTANKKATRMVLLKAGAINLPTDPKDDPILAEMSGIENQAALKRIEERARTRSHIKPFSAHRYFPEADALVAWNPHISSTIGAWFADETDEEIFNKLNKITAQASDVIAWNKDYRLWDPEHPNSTFIQQAVPDLPQRIDIMNPTCVLSAIISPSLMRDLSGARDLKGNLIQSIQFNKQGKVMFGERIEDVDYNTKLQTLRNQNFGSVNEALFYKGSNGDVDYIAGLPKGVRYSARTNLTDEFNKHVEGIPAELDKLFKDNGLSWQNNKNFARWPSIPQTAMKQSVAINQNAGGSKGDVIEVGDGNGRLVNPFNSPMSLKSPLMGGSLNSSFASHSSTNFSANMLNTNTGMVFQPIGTMMKSHGEFDNDYNVNDSTKTYNIESAKGINQTVSGKRISDLVTENYLQSFPSTKGVQNAFPTYKMYIIKSDTSEYKWSSMDDYWDYRLVQDLMIVRDKNAPTHMLKARIIVDPRYVTIRPDYKQRTGWQGRLHGLEEQDTGVAIPNRDTFEDASRFYRDKAPLRQGMRICIRLGYHSDPRYLDTVFIGTITELRGSLDSGQYELSAEGDGRELRVPAVHFRNKKSGINYSDIINQILRDNPNVIHFGKVYGSLFRRMSYGFKNLMNLGMLGGGAFVGATGGTAISGFTAYKTIGAFKSMVGFTVKEPKFWLNAAKGGVLSLGSATIGAATIYAVPSLWNGASRVCSMAWDEFQIRAWKETYLYHTLNNYGPRLWLGFLPSNIPGFLKGNIFDADKQAFQLSRHFYNTYKHGNNPVDDNIFAFDIWANFSDVCDMNITNKSSIWEVLQNVRRLYPNYALDIRPFGSRSTIFLGPVGFNYWRTDDPIEALLPQVYQIEGINDDDAGIVNQKVRDGIYSYATPTNPMGDRDVDFSKKDSKDPAPWIPFQKHHIITSQDDIILNSLKPTPERGWNAVYVTYGDDPNTRDESKVISKQANIDLYPESIIRKSYHVDFTTDREIATRFALSFLKEGVERLYGGTIIVRGNQKIEPYDKVYISDYVNKMYGWIQVEAVIHKFDQEMGFTTHIVPNLLCEINNNAYLTPMKIMMSTVHDKMEASGLLDLGGRFATAGAASWLAGAVGINGIWAAVGALMYTVFTSISQFNEGTEAARKAIDNFKRSDDLAFANTINPYLLQSISEGRDVVTIQEIIKTHLEQFWVLKGLQYGTIIGYLHFKSREYTKAHNGQSIFKSTFWNDESVWKNSKSLFGKFGQNISDNFTKARGSISENFANARDARDNGRLIDTGKENIRKLEKEFRAKFSPEDAERRAKLYKDFVNARSNGAPVNGILEEIANIEKKASSEIAIETAKRLTSAGNNINEGNILLKGSGGIASNLTKGGYSKLSKFFKGGLAGAQKYFGGGAITGAFAIGQILDIIPSLGYGFAVKAVTENNAITISPVYWRDGYLMPSLDGYANNDMFSHIGDMLTFYNNVIGEGKEAVHKYMRSTFTTDMPAIKEDVKAVSGSDIQTRTIEENIEKSRWVRCILRNAYPKNSTLINELNDESGFDSIKWNNIARSIENTGSIIRNLVNWKAFALALLYTETGNKKPKFSLDEISSTGAIGLCQIIPTNSLSIQQFQTNYNGILAPYIDDQDKIDVSAWFEKLKSGKFNSPQLISASPKATNVLFGIDKNIDRLPHNIDFNIACMLDKLSQVWGVITNKILAVPSFKEKYDNIKSRDEINALMLYTGYHGINGWVDNIINKFNQGQLVNPQTGEVSSVIEKTFTDSYKTLKTSTDRCSGDIAQVKPIAKPQTVTGIDPFTDYNNKPLRDKLVKKAHEVVNLNVSTSQYSNKTNGTLFNYEFGGKSGVSWDCSGFISGLFGDILSNAKNAFVEPRAVYLKVISKNAESMFNSIDDSYIRTVDTVQPGDLVFWRNKAGKIGHVELYVDKGLSIGATSGSGTISLNQLWGTPIFKSVINYNTINKIGS